VATYIKDDPALVKLILEKGKLVQEAKGHGNFYCYQDMELFLGVGGHYLVYKPAPGQFNHLATGVYDAQG
jgi:hypothetical protein